MGTDDFDGEPPLLSPAVDRQKPYLERLFPNRPVEYATATRWLLAGGARNWRALSVGFLLGWGMLPLALLGAIAGAVSGGLAGFRGSLSFMQVVADAPLIGPFITWGWSALSGVLGGLLGFVLGAVTGMLSGFLLLPVFVIEAALKAGGILQVLLVMPFLFLTAIFIACTYTFVMSAIEGPRNGLSGYRRLSRREAEVLVPLVHACADRLGLLNAPRILIHDGEDPGAFAFTRHIVLTQGLLELVGEDETALAGIICHELVHWRNADAVSSLMVRGMALPAYAVFNLIGGSRRLLLVVLSFPLRVCLRYVFLPAQADASRTAEFMADQGAVGANLAGGLMSALERFRQLEFGVSGWDDAICATHPPTELRIERLEPYATAPEQALLIDSEPSEAGSSRP